MSLIKTYIYLGLFFILLFCKSKTKKKFWIDPANPNNVIKLCDLNLVNTFKKCLKKKIDHINNTLLTHYNCKLNSELNQCSNFSNCFWCDKLCFSKLFIYHTLQNCSNLNQMKKIKRLVQDVIIIKSIEPTILYFNFNNIIKFFGPNLTMINFVKIGSHSCLKSHFSQTDLNELFCSLTNINSSSLNETLKLSFLDENNKLLSIEDTFFEIIHRPSFSSVSILTPSNESNLVIQLFGRNFNPYYNVISIYFSCSLTKIPIYDICLIINSTTINCTIDSLSSICPPFNVFRNFVDFTSDLTIVKDKKFKVSFSTLYNFSISSKLFSIISSSHTLTSKNCNFRLVLNGHRINWYEKSLFNVKLKPNSSSLWLKCNYFNVSSNFFNCFFKFGPKCDKNSIIARVYFENRLIVYENLFKLKLIQENSSTLYLIFTASFTSVILISIFLFSVCKSCIYKIKPLSLLSSSISKIDQDVISHNSSFICVSKTESNFSQSKALKSKWSTLSEIKNPISLLFPRLT